MWCQPSVFRPILVPSPLLYAAGADSCWLPLCAALRMSSGHIWSSGPGHRQDAGRRKERSQGTRPVCTSCALPWSPRRSPLLPCGSSPRQQDYCAPLPTGRPNGSALVTRPPHPSVTLRVTSCCGSRRGPTFPRSRFQMPRN